MSKGCFKCIRSCPNQPILLNCYLPTNQVKLIIQITDVKSCQDAAKSIANFWETLQYPYYIIVPLSEPNVVYTIDPSESEHVERYLAGTDDSLADWVHEMRYNPVWLGADVKEAKRKFNE